MSEIKILYETSDGAQFSSANLAEAHQKMLDERPDKSYHLLVRATGYYILNAYDKESAEDAFAEDLEDQGGINCIGDLMDEWEGYEILAVEPIE